VLGGYYFDEDGKHIDVVEFPFAAIRSGGAFDSRSVAGFGQATYNFSPQLQLTLGLRYSYEKKLFDVEGQRALFAPPPGLLPFPLVAGQRLVLGEDRASNRDGAFTPLVSLSYFFSDEVMTYASYSEGFKSGGFEQRIFPPAQVVPKFDQEKVRVYEVGTKTLLFDNLLRLNGAMFFSDYDDLQISLFDGIAPVTRNAAEAQIKGIELEGQFKPTAELSVDFGFGYLDTRYTDITLQNLGVDRSNDFVNAPDVSATAGLSYTFELGARGALTARGGWSYRSDVANDAVNTEALEQGKVSLYDASLSWDSPDAKWRVTLSGKNLSDREFLIAGSNIVLSGVTEATFDRGRTWALSVERQF
jgi:iron complex outermembrane receptor protein